MSEVFIREEAGLHLDRAVKILSGTGHYGWRNLNRVLRSAAERAAKSGETQAGRFASQRYMISQSGFKSHVHTKAVVRGGKINGGDVSVEISFAGSVIPLISFSTKFSRNGGIQTTVKRGGGGTLSHAFIPENMKLGVYERLTTARFPVEQKYGPSAAHMMMEPEVVQNMEKHMVGVFNQRMEHEITRVLNGW